MLNRNPIAAAKHFQYRVETLLTKVLLTNAEPIGKIVCYALTARFCYCCLFCMRSHPMQDQNAQYEAQVNAPRVSSYLCVMEGLSSENAGTLTV